MCRVYWAKSVVLMSLLVWCKLVFAAETITPIYQVEGAQGDFVQVHLQRDMYRDNLLQSDLKNLLVVDAEQNPLPYTIVNLMPAIAPVARSISSSELLFFPVAIDASPDTIRTLHSEQLQVGAGAAHLIASDKTLNNKTPEFYLLDLSKLNHGITSLVFDWEAKEASQYLEVELEATRNLQDWVSLGRSTLVQIIQEQQSLKKNNIDITIAKQEYKFLRVRVIRGADNLYLNKIIAEQDLGLASAPILTKESWSINGELAKEQLEVGLTHKRNKSRAVAAWNFSRSEVTPAETVAIDFAQTVYSGTGKIWSRDADNQEWQLQYQGIFFNVQIGSQWKTSDPVNIYRKSAKYWRIELNASISNEFQPKLVFAWQPLTLRFIANDKPPFAIAVSSSSNAQHSHQVFTQLIAESSPEWQPAVVVSLDVQPHSIQAAQGRTDWNEYLFWAALILAVLVLLGFSWRLFKQISPPGEKL